MPRPQRSKVAPLTTNARHTSNARKAAASSNSARTSRNGRVSTVMKAKSSSDSDVVGPQGDAGSNPDLMMTGALLESEGPIVSMRQSIRGKTTTSTTRAAKEALTKAKTHIKSRASNRHSRTQHEGAGVDISPNDEDAVDVTEQRLSTPPAKVFHTEMETPDVTEGALDMSPEASPDGNGSEAQQSAQAPSGLSSRRTSVQRPASVLRNFGTPGMETSVLALTRFKRRKRQGSIVGRMHRADAFNSSQIGGLEIESRWDQTNLDLDDFNPDDESTPLHGTVMKDSSHRIESRKRRYDGSPMNQSPSLVPRSSSPLSSVHGQGNDASLESESEGDIVPETGPNTQNADPPQADDNEGDLTSTMAPPLSSSVLEPSSPTLDAGDIHDAQYRSIHMSTIELTSLLPRTRNRKNVRRGTRDVYQPPDSNTDFTSDGIDLESPLPSESEEADETFTSARTRRPVSAKSNTKSTPKTRKVTGRKPLASTKSRKITSKDSSATKSKRRSYRRVAEEEDKENEEDVSYAAEHDTLDDDTVIETAKTMKKMKDKFAEIDQFEMAFETVDVGGENSLWR